jgi:hypothetical protein
MSKPMTAAEHFEKAAELLAVIDSLDPGVNAARRAGDAAVAQAHLTAARLLMDAEALRHAPAALGRSGMDDVIDARWNARQGS